MRDFGRSREERRERRGHGGRPRLRKGRAFDAENAVRNCRALRETLSRCQVADRVNSPLDLREPEDRDQQGRNELTIPAH